MRKLLLITAAVFGALLSAAINPAPAAAAPVEANGTDQAVDEPIVQSAIFEPGSVRVVVVPNSTVDEGDEPTIIIIAELKAMILFPGQADPRELSVPALMSVRKKDLDKFPSPMDMVNRHEGFVFEVLDTVNAEKGMEQIRLVYEKGVELKAKKAAEKNAAEGAEEP